MTSVGSVELELRLDRSQFDKELKAIASEKFEPLSVKLEIDIRGFEKQLKDLRALIEPLSIPVELDIKGIERTLQNFKPEIEVKVNFDENQISSAINRINAEIKAQIQTTVKVERSESGNSGSLIAGIESAFSKSLDSAFDRNRSSSKQEESTKSFVDFTLTPIKAVNSALQSVVSGAFENIGRSLTDSLGKSLGQGLNKEIGQSLSDFGKETGKLLGVVGKELGVKGGAQQQKSQQQKNSTPEDPSLVELKQTFKTITNTTKAASDALQTFGINISGLVNPFNKTANAALTLATAFSRLEGSTGDKGGNSGQPPVTRGFLTGDFQDLTPLQARAQAELSAKQLERRFNQLKAESKSDQTRTKIAQLIAEITEIEKRIATDIANSAISESVHRSLGQLKGAKGALTKLKNEAARASLDLNNLTGEPSTKNTSARVSDIGLAQVRRDSQRSQRITNADVLQALKEVPRFSPEQESKMASVNFGRLFKEVAKLSGLDVNSVKGNRPSLQFGGLPDNVAGRYNPTNNQVNLSQDLKSKLAQGLLTKADLDTIIHEIRHALQLDFGRIRTTGLATGSQSTNLSLQSVRRGSKLEKDVDGSVTEFKEAFKEKFGKYPPEKLVATIRKLEADAYAFAQSSVGQISGNLSKILKLDRSPIRSPKPNPPPKQEVEQFSQAYFDGIFRRLEAKFYRSQMMQAVPVKERRSLVSEASGFLFSGAAMMNPAATFGALLAPLAPAVAPLAVTFGMLNNALQPLIQVIVDALRKLEPAQKRLEFVAGSKEGGVKQSDYVQNLSSSLNVPLLASLEGYSKLAVAAKGTRLEGAATQELFEGIATASKALQLSQEDLNLVMFAFTQVLSKGRLTAEEVRLQIAERLPGAITVFSKSLGVSTQEFNALLESGSLLVEDVLPKVGRGLKEQFGKAAAESSGSFLSSITKLDNAVLKLQKGLGDSFGGLFAGFTNTFAGLVEFVANNIDRIIQVASVALIGIGAQFFVGLTTILNGSGITAKVTAALVPLFGRVFATLTPFAVGILADFLDDVFGTKASVMDNMTQGFYNMVVSVILVIDGLIKKIGELFTSASTGSNALGEMMSSVGSFLAPVGNLGNGVVKLTAEFAALTLMLIQTAVLGKMALGPVIANLIASVKALGIAFVDSVKSGRVLQSSMNTLTAGLSKSQLALAAASAAVILFFAKADFSDELGSKFDKLGDRMSEALYKIRNATAASTEEIGKFKQAANDFKSKGFDLSFGLGGYLGKPDGYKTDDVIKDFRNIGKNNGVAKNTSNAIANLFGGFIAGEISNSIYNSASNGTIRTLGENQFDNTLIKIEDQAKQANEIIDRSGLLSGTFFSNPAGKAYARKNEIDSELKDLARQRFDIVSQPGALKNPNVSKAVQDLENRIKDLQQEREAVIKPLQEIKDSVINGEQATADGIKAIEESDAPPKAKEDALNRLTPRMNTLQRGKSQLEKLKAVDLSVLGNEFSETLGKIEKSRAEFSLADEEREVAKSKAISDAYQQFTDGKINKKQLDTELQDIDRKDLDVQTSALTERLSSSRDQKRDLLVVPSPSKEQKQEIEKTAKEIRDTELKLAQARIQLAQKVTEGKRLAEEQALQNFQDANTKALSLIQQGEINEVIGVRSRQLLGGLSPEQAEAEIAKIRSKSANKELSQAQSSLANFRQLKSEGKITPETAVKQELELQKQLSDAALKAIESEQQAREAAKQKRLKDIEEIKAKEEFGISQKLSKGTTAIKEQQIAGLITDKDAQMQIADLDIEATNDRIASKEREYDRIADLRKDGTLSAKQAAEMERQIQTELAQFEGQLTDQRLQKQQAYREKVLADLELVNKQAEAVIAKVSSERAIALTRRQMNGGDLAGDFNQPKVAIATNQNDQATTRDEIEDTKRKIRLAEQNRDNRIITERQATEEILALNRELASKNQALVSQQLDAERLLRDERIAGIERVAKAEEARFKRAQGYIDSERANLDLYTQSLDRTAKLEESRYNLQKAVADAGTSDLEIRKDGANRALEQSRRLKDENLDPSVRNEIQRQLGASGFGSDEMSILAQRQKIEQEIADRKLEALKLEQQYQRQALLNDLKRQKIQAQMAVYEAETSKLSAAKSKLEAESALRVAQIKQDPVEIEIAKVGVELAGKETTLADRKLAFAQEGLSVQDELARNAIMTQEATQRAALSQQLAANSAQKQAQALERVEASVKASDANSKGGTTPSDWTNPYIQKQGESMFDYANRINQDKIFGRIVETSERKTLAPIYTNQAMNNQAMTTVKTPSVMPPTDTTAETAKASEIKPTDTTTGYAQFVDALKVANSGVEARLDKLIGSIASLSNAPRSLTVQSPNPVDDAASIFSEFAAMEVRGAGL
jgi:tape measure domain-containing protein